MRRALLSLATLFGLLGAAQAQTSCGLLSQCPNASLPLNGTELMYIVQGGISKQTNTSNFMGVSSSIIPLNNIWTGNNTFSGTTNIFESGNVNYTLPVNDGSLPPTPAIANSIIGIVQGTVSSSLATDSSTLIVQKIGAIGNPALFATLYDIGGSAGVNVHGTAVIGLSQTSVAYTSPGPFFEGTRGNCDILSTSTNAQCNGGAYEVSYATTNHTFAIGIESDVANFSGSDDTQDNYSNTAFLASTNPFGGTSWKVGAAYMVNPFQPNPFIYGIWIPTGTTEVSAADIRLANTAQVGIDFHAGGSFVFDILLANDQPIGASNAANSINYSLLYVSPASTAVFAGDPGLAGVTIASSGVPTTVQQNLGVLGNFQVFGNYQSADGSFGVSCSAGTVNLTTAVFKNGLLVKCN